MIGYTIVGGFLGVGKTTLVNSVLLAATERIAVVVNDLGEVNVDAELIRSVTDDTVELTNGCVCCSIGDSLAATLRALCERDVPPDRVVVECSGAADPAAVARYGSRAVLSEPAIVVVADATDVRRRAADRRFAVLVGAQLDSADLVVVSKSDLVDPDELAELIDWLARRTGGPVVVGHPEDLGVVLPGDRALATSAPVRLRTEVWRPSGPIGPADLRRSLSSVPGLVRAKGIVATVDGPVVVQFAAGRFEVRPHRGARVLDAVVLICAEEPSR